MKRAFLVLAVLLLSVLPVSARSAQTPQSVEHTMTQLIDAREKLIKRYVFDKHLAWGVSVCGQDDLFSGRDHSWLTVYVYEDSLRDFAIDFDNFAKATMHGRSIDGVDVMVEVVKRKPQH